MSGFLVLTSYSWTKQDIYEDPRKMITDYFLKDSNQLIAKEVLLLIEMLIYRTFSFIGKHIGDVWKIPRRTLVKCM